MAFLDSLKQVAKDTGRIAVWGAGSIISGTINSAPEIVKGIHKIADKVENNAMENLDKLKENLDSGSVFNKGETKTWHCRNCGYIYEGEEAPAVCPVCNHPQAYFELEQTNY